MITNGAVRPWGRVVAFIVCVFVPVVAPSSSVAKPAGAPKASVAGDPFEDSTIPGKLPVPTKADAAPKESTPPPHLPSREFGAFMKGFEGAWKCETHFAVGALWPGSQAISSKTEVTIRKEFEGFMWHGEFKTARTATAPATTGVFQIGYATPSKQVTYLSYDSVGSSMMGVGTISGAQVTFLEEGFVKGAKVNVRETLAKQGPRKIVHKVELDQGKGLQPMAEDTCVK